MASAPTDARPAGFWARYAAWSLDAACLLPLVALLGAAKLGHAWDDAGNALQAIHAELPRLLGDALDGAQAPMAMAQAWLADPQLAAGVAALESALATMLYTPLVLYVLLALAWSVGFERSSWRATPGKRALGLRVVASDGRRLTAGHALQRFLAAGVSWLTLNIGHAMAALPPEHLALHDRLSDTRVVRDTAATGLPAWAKAWLAAQLLAAAFAAGWGFVSLQVAMQAVMQQALGGI